MSKSREDIKKELLEGLDDSSVSQVDKVDKEFIINVVNLMDNQMMVKKDEKARVKTQTNRMIDLCRRIKQGKTGVPEIDEHNARKKQQALQELSWFKDAEHVVKSLDFSDDRYVYKLIEMISENGGLMRYARKSFRERIDTPYDEEPGLLEEIPVEECKSREEVQADLLDDLKAEDIYKSEMDYIKAAVLFIDEQTQVPEEEKATIDSQVKRMAVAYSKIQKEKTGISDIDDNKEKRREEILREVEGTLPPSDAQEIAEQMIAEPQPYVDNYISCISSNGGLYAVGLDAMKQNRESEQTHDSNRRDNPRDEAEM